MIDWSSNEIIENVGAVLQNNNTSIFAGFL
jgi:hypothetical protein